MSWRDTFAAAASSVKAALLAPIGGQKRDTGGTGPSRFKPSWWDSYLLSLSVVTTAEVLAGILREAEAGDPRRFFALCDRMRAQDAHMDSELQKAEDALTEAGVTFLPWSSTAEDPKADREATEVLAYVKRVLGAPDVDLDEAVVACAHADWKMAGAFSFVTRVEGNEERVVEVREIPAVRFRMTQELDAAPRWVYSPDGDPTGWEPVEDQGAAVVARFTDEGIPSLANRGLMRRLINLFLIKTRGLVWWAQSIEKFGLPLLYIEEDTSDDARLAELTTLLKNLGAQGVGVFPRGSGPKVLEVAMRITGEVPHEKIADWCDRQVSRAIHGHDQSSGVQRDAASKQSQDTAGDAALRRGNARGKRIGTFLRQQLVKPLVARRFGDQVADRSTPLAQIRAAKEKDLVKFTESVKNAVESNIELDEGWFFEETGWRQPAAGAKTIKKAAPPALPAPPDGGKVLPFPNRKAAMAALWGELMAASHEDVGPSREDLDEIGALAKRQAKDSGRELLGPYRDLIAAAVKEDATVAQVISRVVHQATLTGDLDSDRFAELMQSARLEALRLGAVRVRDGRAANG